MSTGWVAGSVRARALARRRPAFAAARAIAGRPDLAGAIEALGPRAYRGRLSAAAPLAEIEHAVAAEVLWQMRVLAGWSPAAGVTALRALAGWFEIANVERHLRDLAGLAAEAPFALGRLATAWTRLAAMGSPARVRAVLATSAWGDPGEDSPRAIGLAMRLTWAHRVSTRVPGAAGWARQAAALLVARERFALNRPLPAGARRAARLTLGPAADTADTLADLSARLAPRTARVLAGVTEPRDLWRAETRWWSGLRTDSAALLVAPGFGPERIVGAVAVLAGYAWLDRAALELAARGGAPLEAFDALA